MAFAYADIFEVLLEGSRGTGKTDSLLMDFAQHIGQGWGAEWRGILFRQTFPQLKDVIKKTKKWFPQIFPAASYNNSEHYWKWPTGEVLQLAYMSRPDDYWNYHGHEYPWVGFEELTTWPTDECYTRMFSCCRSTGDIRMPRKVRATTNPYGVGHNWVKARFGLPALPGKIINRTIHEEGKPPRVSIRSRLVDNKVLLATEPDYIEKIRAAARNPAELAAWIDGDWDIIAGGMFDDLWSPGVHIVPDVDLGRIPSSWRVNRSYDHGQSAPFSVGWWAQSNGEPITVDGRKLGTVRGDLIRIAEWYGWTGRPNEGVRMLSTDIADGIVERESAWKLKGHSRPGPADSSIFDDFEPGKSVAGDMEARGVRWECADKGPGSRKQGWDQFRKLLAGAHPGEYGFRERPGLFVCRRCEQFIRTIPVLPRDDKDIDDVDTDAEDHIADEARYRLRERVRSANMRSF
jgi:hypothetical protein